MKADKAKLTPTSSRDSAVCDLQVEKKLFARRFARVANSVFRASAEEQVGMLVSEARFRTTPLRAMISSPLLNWPFRT